MSEATPPFVAGTPDGVVVLAGATDGYPVIATPTPLTRLNFFDGRFLRGEDLTAEAGAQRELVFASNRAAGSGVAHGLEVTRADGDRLRVGSGLALDPRGRVLLLTQPVTVSVADLLDASRRRSAPTPRPGTKRAGFGACEVVGEQAVAPVQGAALYLLTVGHVEGLCGDAEVFGRLCEEACVTSTDRPYRIDGIVLRLRPLVLSAPLPISRSVPLDGLHLRSRVASAHFADGRADPGVLLSGAGLLTPAWCLGAPAPEGTEVPLAVLARAGAEVQFLDQWTARRELLDAPARTYWAGRMRMRPWNAFLAEVLQFQCQLRDVGGGAGGLVPAGIVELPPAGYLPVDPREDLATRLQAVFGPGVNLRFVGLPVDELAHEFELAQHLDRIGLLPGLDDPSARAEVDVFVPDGTVVTTSRTDGLGFAVRARFGRGRREEELPVRGVLRFRSDPGGGFAVAGAGVGQMSSRRDATGFVRAFADAPATEDPFATLADTIPEPGRLPLSLARIRLTADQARRFAATRRAESESGRAKSERLYTLKAERAEAEPIALRIVLFSQRDPWQLEVGQTTFVQATIEHYAPSSPELLAFELTGATLLVLRATGNETRRRLAVRLAGPVQIRQVSPRGETVETMSWEQNLSVLLSRDGDQRRIEVATRGEAPVLTVSWGGGPISGEAELAQILRVLVDEDGDVFSPSDEFHQYAASALQILQGAHPTDPDYRDRAMAEQFGADPGGTSSAVAATRDWVLFRRRRHGLPAAPTPADTEQVALWVSTSPDPDTAAAAADALIGGRGGDIAWRRVQSVGFDAGAATSTTSAALVRGAYRQAGGASVLVLVGYATADGPMAHGRARTEALVRMLSPVAELAPGGRVDEIADPPPGFLEGGTSGSVFLVSHPASKVVTYQLRVLSLHMDRAQQVVKQATDAIESNDPERLGALVDGRTLLEVGEVTIADNVPDEAQFDDVVARVRTMLTGQMVQLDTPRLWIDGAWADAHPIESNSLIGRHAEVLVNALNLGLTSRRRVTGLGSDRPAWLLLAHVAIPG